MDAPMNPAETTAAEALARTLYAEAGTRPLRAIEALASLVANRARAAAPRPPRIPGAPPFAPGGHARLAAPHAGTVLAICRDPFLFPARNPRHPAHALLSALFPGDPALAVCRRVAARALSGSLADPTGGATHWHPAERLPGWAVARDAVEVGGLAFYWIEGGPRPERTAGPALVVAA